jgi:hypothetical protein
VCWALCSPSPAVAMANRTAPPASDVAGLKWWYLGPSAALLGLGGYIGYRRTLKQEAEVALEAAKAAKVTSTSNIMPKRPPLELHFRYKHHVFCL